jgi:hypothetical protein
MRRNHVRGGGWSKVDGLIVSVLDALEACYPMLRGQQECRSVTARATLR